LKYIPALTVIILFDILDINLLLINIQKQKR